jgi:transposase-like protein
MTPSQKRASLILQVRAGQLTAQEAARQLGISRQAYYQWEKRALSALLAALEEQPKGRPKRPADPEKEQLHTRVKELERKLRLYEEKERLRKLLKQLEEPPGGSSPKKKPRTDEPDDKSNETDP